MIFYYDPILGLQYFFVGNNIEINLAILPDVNVEEVLAKYIETGISLCNSNEDSYVEEHLTIHTNA